MGSPSPVTSFGGGGFSQQHFGSQFDFDDPRQAMSAYARAMHAHTKQQFDMATTSARRRSQGGSTPTLRSDTASVNSVGSTAS